MKTFVVVGASERIVTAVLQGVYCFSQSPVIVIGNAETYKLAQTSLCSQHIYVNFNASAEHRTITAINQLHAENPDTVVIPADCHGIRLINRIQSNLRARVTPIPDLATLNQLDDKWHFYELCKACDIDVPDTYYVGSKVNLNFDDLARKLGLPFVIKPSNESGSLGVQIIRSKEHYLRIVKNNENYQFNSLIAQRYIDGQDIDLSLLALHGYMKAFAIQRVVGPVIEFMQNDRLEALAGKLCRTTSFHGLMHIDARLERSTGRVFLIESNPRFWASLTASIWCGLNFVEESIRENNDSEFPRRLVSGTAHLRHPLLRPSSWGQLFHSDQRGRLTRASMIDPYALGRLARELPVNSARYIGRHFTQRMHGTKSSYGVR